MRIAAMKDERKAPPPVDYENLVLEFYDNDDEPRVIERWRELPGKGLVKDPEGPFVRLADLYP